MQNQLYLKSRQTNSQYNYNTKKNPLFITKQQKDLDIFLFFYKNIKFLFYF